jgi:hypothetical protein
MVEGGPAGLHRESRARKTHRLRLTSLSAYDVIGVDRLMPPELWSKEKHVYTSNTLQERHLYSDFERLFRLALRGYGLSFRWDIGECSVFSR